MTTAREDLLAMIFPIGHLDETNRKLVEEGVDRLLGKHAHELAETIRAFADQENGRLRNTSASVYVQGIRDGANLIDPKVRK